MYKVTEDAMIGVVEDVTEDERETTLPGLSGVTIGETQRGMQAARERSNSVGEVDRRICSCGHSIRSHLGMPGAMLCRPTKMECPCRNAEPVLLVQDVRQFQWATAGYGGRHALSLGIGASLEKGKKVEWIVDPECRICGREDGLVPVAISPGQHVSDRPERLNGLLCASCIGKIGVV